MSQSYTIRMRETQDGWFLVSCDEVPGALSQGYTVRDALEMMGEAMALMLEDEE
jgi:predicted RNase H-like HicB family nuclease